MSGSAAVVKRNQAIKLSMNLINISNSSHLELNKNKVIYNLKNLSQRLQYVNNACANQLKKKNQQQFINITPNKINNVDLSRIRQELRFAKSSNSNEQVSQKQTISIYQQLNQSFSSLKYEQFSIKKQQKMVYRALHSCLNSDPPSNCHEYLQTKLTGSIFKKQHTQQFGYEHVNELQFTQIKDIYNSCLKWIIQRYKNQCNYYRLDQQCHIWMSQYFQIDNKRYFPKWLKIINRQIQISYEIFNQFIQGQLHISPKNYLNTVSIQSLCQLYNLTYQQNQKKLIQLYNLTEHDKNNWFDLFLKLRRGMKYQFLQDVKQHRDRRYFQNFIHALNEFRPYHEKTSVNINENSKLFQKILKGILIGKYEGYFDDAKIQIQALDIPWIILLNYGRKHNKQDKRQIQKKKHLTSQNINEYMSKIKQQLFFKNNQNNQFIENIITGFISLGIYDQLFQLYNQLKSKSKLKLNTNYVSFIHIFILLVLNPQLIYVSDQSTDIDNNYKAGQLLIKMLQQISKYASLIKKQSVTSYRDYLLIIFISIFKINQINATPYDTIMKKILPYLDSNIQDLQIGQSNLQYLNHYSPQFSLLLAKYLITNTRLKQLSDYFNLSEYCSNIGYKQLSEHILFSMLVKYYLNSNTDKQVNYSNNQLWNISTKQFDIQQTQQKLISMLSNNKEQLIINFVYTLKELDKIIKKKDKNSFIKHTFQFSKFRTQIKQIQKYLRKVYNSGYNNYDILVYYYYMLAQCQKICFLRYNDITQYRKKSKKICQQIQEIEDKFQNQINQVHTKLILSKIRQ